MKQLERYSRQEPLFMISPLSLSLSASTRPVVIYYTTQILQAYSYDPKDRATDRMSRNCINLMIQERRRNRHVGKYIPSAQAPLHHISRSPYSPFGFVNCNIDPNIGRIYWKYMGSFFVCPIYMFHPVIKPIYKWAADLQSYAGKWVVSHQVRDKRLG